MATGKITSLTIYHKTNTTHSTMTFYFAKRYWFILLTAVGEFAAFALGISLAVYVTYSSKYAILKYNYLLMAIILSSFGKGLLFLMMVWDYTFQFSTFLDAFILSSNVVALKGMFVVL